MAANLDSRFQVENSVLGPQNINPGNTADFVVIYTIRAGAAAGSFPVVITPKSDTTGLVPGFDSAIVTINFTVDSTPPALSFINDDGTPLLGANGLPVLIGDTIYAMAVTIRADDTGGSGIASVTISGPSPFEPTIYDGLAVADKKFADLADGAYIATVTDRAGNVSKISFTIGADRYPPLLTIRKSNADGEILGDGGDTDIRTLHINATDIVLDARPRQTGISRIEIIGLDPHNDFENYIDYAGEADVSFSTTLPLGDYWIIATDREGNVAEKTFGIISATGPIASLFVPNYRQLYSEFRGVSVSTPSTVSVNTGLGGNDIFDPVTGEPASSGVMYYTARGLAVGAAVPAPISQVRVTGPNFNYVADFSPPRANVDVEGMGVLKAGTYQVTMKDIAQGETFMPFRIVDLTAYLCPDVQSAFVSTTTFTVDNFICLKSSLGLKSLQESTVNPPIVDVGSVIPVQGTSLHYPSPATVHESKGVQRGFTITDIESNGTAFEARALVETVGFGGISNTPGNLSIKSDPFDLKATRLQVSSARFIAGDGNVGFTEHVVRGATIDGSSQTVGRLIVRLDGAVIVDRKIALGAELPDEPFSGIRAIGRFPVLTAELSEVSVRGTVYPANCRTVNKTNSSLCDDGSIYFPWMSNVHGTIVGVAPSVHGSVNYSANVFAGGPASVVLAPGVELGLPSHGPSKISLTLSSRKAPLRYKILPSNTAYRIAAQIDLFGQPATVSLPFSTTGLTPGQLAQLTVLQATKLNPGPNDFLPIPSRIADGKVIGTTSNLSSPEGVEFMVAAPIHENAHVVENADLAFQSNRSDIQLVATDISNFSLKKVLAILGAKGFVPVTPVYHLGPDGAEFAQPGVIEMKFTDDQLARLGIAKSTLRILQFNGSGTVLEMPAQVLGDDKIAAKVPFLTSNFAVFGEGKPVYVDLSPPQTTASYTGRTGTSAGGTILLDPGALVRLTAVDPEAPNFSTSGVSQTRFLLDQVFIDTAATPGELYVSSFTLSTGAHSLAYYSVDHAGNVEPVIRAALFVATPDTAAPQTTILFSRAVSSDTAGRTVLDTLTEIGIAAVDPVIAGVPTSGVAQTRVLIDQTFIDTSVTPGAVYVSTFALSTGAHSLSYYSVDNAGNVEPVNRASLFVTGPPADTLAPQTAVFFSQPISSDTAGRTVLDVLTEIGLSAVDPAITGFPTSGVAQTRFLIDRTFIDTAATPGAVYASTFTLSTGAHSLAYYSVDQAGNVESARSLSVMVGPAFGDSMPPRTALAVGPPASSSGVLTYVSTSSLLGFVLSDDKIELNDGLGAGATQTFYAMDGGAYARFASSFSLSVEGRRSLSFFSIDRAGNVEAPRERSLGIDSTPPSSALSSNGALYSISAADVLSGVATVFYWVDVNPGACGGVVPDTGAARGTCANPTYAGPFPLAGGQHTVYFQAIDAVGNREFLHADNVMVSSPDSASSGGLGIGRDPFDAFWSVLSVNEALAFARADSFGAPISSAPLPDAAFGFPWSVFFDAAGRAYAIGLAEGTSTLGTDVAVYKASPAGNAIDARILFDSGYANNDLVLDAKAPGWLVGAAQTSGPMNLDLDGERNFALALWKFDPALGTVALSTTFARGTFDVGAGVAVDADGSLWISGYSLRPGAPAVRGFDLALWHYAANGKTLLGGPFLWPGYLSDFDGSITARVHVSGDSVYIAAPRVGVSSGTDMAFLRFDKAASRATSERVWRASDGSASYPAAILPEAAGLIVAGGIGAGESQAALWRFGHDGALRGATLADAGGAQGAVLRGAELWLSVDGSTLPYKVLAETPAAGSLVDISTPPAQALTVSSIAPASGAAGTSVAAAVAGTGFDASAALSLERSDALRGTWAATGSFTQARFSSTLTKLRDGRVLLAGGMLEGSAVGLSAVDLYDPATGSWTAGPPLRQGRNQSASVMLADGRVLVAGGYNGTSIGSVEIYDPTLNTWTAAAPMASVRVGHQLALLSNGRVLAAGGWNGSSALNSAEIYDPVANAWSPAAAMSAGRINPAMTTLGNGKVLISGGNNNSSSNASAEIYDPATNAWSAAGTMSAARYLHRFTVLPGGKVLASGGANASETTNSADVYDPTTNGWTATGPLGVRRYIHATVLVNGTPLIIGGENFSTALASTEIYDAAANAWRPGPSLMGTRTWLQAAVLDDGRVLVAGGRRGLGGGTNLNSAELLGTPSAQVAATGVTVTDAQHLSGTLSLTGAATGYWDVVVRESGGRVGRLAGGFQVLPGAPTLASIAVTPASASILAGTTAQFAAAGTFSDGSTRTLTGEVVWSTDVSSVATVTASGLAMGVGGGTARVIASSGGIAGRAALTVTMPALVVNSIAPSSAASGASVAAAVAGTGFDASAALSLERSDVLRGTWTATGSFTQARFSSTLTKLRDGRVLLAGGMLEGSAVGLSTVDLYDPATGIWTAGPPLARGRNQHAAIRLADGRVLVAGGYDGSRIGSVEIYDPATNAWTAAASMSRVRQALALALLPDGRVLAAGGYDSAELSSAEIYDPSADAWSPAPAMSAARFYPAVATLTDGRILIAGGTGVATAEIYDPVSNAWSAAGTMSTARYLHRLVVLPDGKVLVSGGGGPTGATDSADVYDPATNGWTSTGPLGVQRYIHAMVLVNGTPLIIGGENISAALASTEIYDAAANVWRPGPSFSGTRTWLQAVVLDDGRVFVAGGRRGLGGGTNLNSAELLGTPSAQIAATGVTVADAKHLSGTLSLTGAATGYWDVVVRETGGRVGRLAGGFQVLPGAPTLASIAVTPASASILAGATAQFAAAGTYSDGSTRTLTGEVAWSTDVSSVATVTASGLATGVGGGTTRVIVSSGAISGRAALTVTVPPLAVTSIAPVSGIAGADVAAAVVGTGFDATATLSLERSDALRGTWAATGSFTQARFSSTLTKLRDGRVLLAGGMLEGSAVGLSAVDLYDPATGLWTAGPPLRQGRNQSASVMLADGRVLVAGGYNGTSIGSVEIYDPTLNTWTAATPMASVRVGHQLALLSNGRVLAAGGWNGSSVLNSAEIYDPVANAWSPAATMSVGRINPAMTTLGNGKVLISGGNDNFSSSYASAEIYDPATNAWSAAGTMSVARYLHRFAVLPGGKVLASGGANASETTNSADVYDPTTNGWTATGPLGVRRYIHATVLANGTPLIIGGENFSTALATTEIYDAAANAWRPGPSLMGTRTWLQAAVLDDGRVLVAGGRRGLGGGTNLNSAELLGAPSAQVAAAGVTVTDAKHLSGTLSLTGAATGYWDVVVRETGGRVGRLVGGFQVLPGAPTLASIAVTPASASILAGATAQFAAAGTFSDGSTRTLTGEVVWSTDVSSVATVTASGLATAVAGGTTRVIVSSGAISGRAALTVTVPPLAVSSIAPSSAASGMSVAAAVVGTGFDATATLSLERSDALRGTWAATGSFTQARMLGTMTKLRDGRVLLAGGMLEGSAVGLSAVDLYDPATGSWTAGPPLRQGRNQYASVILADGRVLVAGGVNGTIIGSVEIYDPTLNTWTAAAPMLHIRQGHEMALLPNGRVLAAGGWNGSSVLNSAEIYDPVTNTWSSAAAMSVGRIYPAMTVLGNGKVLISGGNDNISSFASAEIYDLATNVWSAAGTMSAGRHGHRLTVLPSGKVLASGGANASVTTDSADVYDPATNGWTATGPLGARRYFHAMVLVNGTPLIIGGENSSTALASTEIYDAAANAWRSGPSLSGMRAHLHAAVLDDGRVLVAGGRRGLGGGTNLNSAELLGTPSAQVAATGVTVADAKHLSGTLSLTGAATGYWDVVVRETGGRVGRLAGGFQVLPGAPTLASIAVTPASASILAGTTAQFAAAGTYSDGSTRTLTGEVVWSTDVSSVATVTASGLATGVGGGTTRVIASSGDIAGRAALSVAYVATSTVAVGGTPELTLVSTAPLSVVIASTEAGAGAVALGSAAAQGLTLVGTVYDVTRQDPGASAILTWSFDPTLVDASTLAIWRFDGISWSSVTVLNQVVSVAGGVGTVTGEVTLTSLFGLFVRDVVAPVTTLLVDGLPSGATSRLIAPSSAIGFAAADAGMGVRETRYGLDGGPETVFVSPFSLTEGRHALTYRSVDRAGNREEAKSASVAVDATAPRTSLIATGGRQYPGVDGASFYASSDTRIGLAAEDPLIHGVASGLALTEFRKNGGAFQAFVASLALTEGTHSLDYRSRDNVGNLELLKSAAVFVDATAPLTSLQVVGGRRFPGPDAASVYASSDTRLVFVASDPLVNGSASGVALTRWQDNGGIPQTFASDLALAEGAHTLAYQSLDNVSNLEVQRSTVVLVDATPPVSAVAVGTPSFTAADGTVHVAPATPVGFTAADPALPSGQAGAGVERVEVSVDGGVFVPAAGPLTFTEGRHDVLYRALDNVGNVEKTRALSIQSDATPPATTLSISTPVSGGYVSGAARFVLAAVDPVVNGAASGVKFVRYRVNGGAFVTGQLDFGLSGPDGAYTLEYQGEDNIGHLEVMRSTAVILDRTPPVTAVQVGASSFTAADGTLYVDPAAPITLAAADSASGVGRIEASVDGAPFAAYTAALTFAEGRHVVQYRAVDKVGNEETVRTLSLRSDATPPLTTFAPSGALFTAGERSYAPAQFTYALPAQDPVAGSVASGAASTRYRTTPGAYQNFAAVFSLSEGIRRVEFQSQDNVGNLELLKGATVFVDATSPVSAFAIGNPKFDPGNGLPVFVAAATPLTLNAQDPESQEVASGLRQISFRRGGDPFGTYLAPFTQPLPDGLKTLDYFATDNVGNQEVNRSTTVALDNTPPLTALVVFGGRQFPVPNPASFYASSDTRLALPAADPVMGGVASGLALTQWQDNSGVFQNFAASFGLAEGSHLLAYQSQDRVQNLEVLRSTTVLVDATPPVSSVSIGAPTFTASDGGIYITPATPVTLSAADPSLPTGQPGSGVSRIEVAIDGGNFSAYSSALTFAEGCHTILYRAVDNVANVEVVHTLQVRSDATPPVSSLVIGAPQFQLPSVLLVSTRTPFSISPVDPIVNNVASGVRDASFRVSDLAPGAGAFSAFTAPFTMTGNDVNKVIEFFSRDNVLTAEAARTKMVLLDSAPPEVALLSPASCGAGICRVLKGKFPVLGTARDAHFANYQLEFAPGKDASAGFALISSGTVAVSSGSLGTWDATALSGWLTLRLTAADLVANAVSVSLNVFAGDPGQSLVLGNHETFDMPEGVAVDGNGKIYVADRNNDRIAVFSSTGALLASLGGRKDDDNDDDEDDDKHKKSMATLRLNKPSGVAVDVAGNIYVADTNRDRVLKLSAAGQVLLTLGRRERHDENDHARALPGQFQHPAGVAVDEVSNIYVADTGNRRVQVFSSTGAFSFQFDLPPVPARLDDDDDGDDDDEEGRVELGKPSGIAVDAAGHIYVADSKGGRALKFGTAGQLLLTIPIPGDKPGKFGQPFGVAVSSGGDCLLVSDRKTSRILKFDFLGNSNLVFGGKGKIKDDDDAPVVRSAIVFKKPMGLALDAQGNLFVADRNNSRIQKLGLPTGQAPLVVPPPKTEDEHIARDVVDVEDGGKIERRDRAAVEIPAGAVALDLKISVSTPSLGVVDDSNRRRAAEDAKLKAASPPVEYGPEGTKFKGSVTLTLPYSPELVALQKIDAKDLKVRYWNRGKSEWEDLESVVDHKTRTVKAKTTHFSLYQVFSGTVSAAAIAPLAADATFTFHDAYAFPNPVRGAGPITIRIQTGLADSVEVRVYDISGRKIHSSSNFSLNPSLDDGNGKGEQYTYDHVWDVSGVGSGVYQYVITAKKAGHSDIHKAGRMGVIK